MIKEFTEDERLVIVHDGNNEVLERFRVKLNGIRSVKGMLQGLWTLAPFSKGLSGRNGFSDVDAHVEIDGRSLILEFKQSFRGLNRGQVLKAIRQAKFQKTSTIFIEGDTDQPVRMFAILETGVEGRYHATDVCRTDLEDMQDRIRSWEKWAREHSLVKGHKTEEWNDTLIIMNNARTSSV